MDLQCVFILYLLYSCDLIQKYSPQSIYLEYIRLITHPIIFIGFDFELIQVLHPLCINDFI